jgi:hypothetical protein
MSRDKHCTVASQPGRHGVSTRAAQANTRAGRQGRAPSTSSWRDSSASESRSPQGTTWWPWHSPKRNSPMVNTWVVREARGGQQARRQRSCPARCRRPLAANGGPPRLGVRVWLLVELAAGDVQVVAYGFQVVLHLLQCVPPVASVPGSGATPGAARQAHLDTQVAGAEHVLDLARHQQRLDGATAVSSGRASPARFTRHAP